MSDEISLRDIIDTIFKGKWIIITVVVILAFITGLYSFFVIPSTYESKSLVRMQASEQEGEGTVDLNIFTDTLKSDTTIKRIMDKLSLEPGKYNINSIRNMINVEVGKETNILSIKITGSEPLIITNIANMLAYEVGNRVEITEKSQDIVDTRRQLDEVIDNIASANSELMEAQLQLKTTPEKQVTKQALTKDPLLQSIVKDSTNATIAELSGIQIESEEINPIYIQLQSKIAETSINLKKLENDKKNLEDRIKENTDRINSLDKLIQQDLSVKETQRMLNGNQAVFVSPAIQPDSPVGSHSLYNVIIAAFVGGVISAIYVLLREYMRKTNKPVVIE